MKNNYYHGQSYTKTYRSWDAMVGRCYNKTDKKYKNYGGRGIVTCDEWLKFEGFYKDMGDRPKGLTLDRIDSNKNYSKENCRWSTQKVQQNNRTNNRILEFNGKSQTVSEWADELQINYSTLANRINFLGWSVEKALLTPVDQNRNWRKRSLKEDK